MGRKVDILNLEHYSFPTRDTEKVSLIANYLRMQGAEVREDCVFNGYSLLLKYRPKILLITGIIGAHINMLVSQFAKYLGCTVVSLTAEGGSHPDWGARQFLYLLEGQEYCMDYWLQWSETDRQERIAAMPEYAESFVTNGSIGHDRYLLPRPAESLIDRTGYKAVIGIGGWRWDSFCNLTSLGNIYAEEFSESEHSNIESFFTSERQTYSQIISNIIKNNPQILFILKLHPTKIDLWSAGFELCPEYPNVKILTTEPISDCINSCDAWISVESNTSVEAWLLGKPTAIINPSGTTWPIPRGNFHTCQPNLPTVEAIQDALNYLEEHHTFPGFEELAAQRQALLKGLIEHTDGLNHVRAGNFLLNLLDKPARIQTHSTLKDHAKYAFNNVVHWNFSRYHKFMPKNIPYFKQFEHFWEIRKLWNPEERKHTAERWKPYQMEYYKKLGLSLEDLSKI